MDKKVNNGSQAKTHSSSNAQHVSANAKMAYPAAQLQQNQETAVDLMSTLSDATMPVQRVKEVVGPANATAIPDMTQGQINTFNASRTPQDTLDNMSTMNLLSAISGIPPMSQIGLTYSEDKAIFGEAFYDNTKDPKYWIKIYKPAFDEGLAAVYSTLRHELIHIAQYYKQVKSAAGEALVTDVTFTDSLVAEATYQAAAEAASEVETYAWEISNAGSTGVSKAYIYKRGIGLEQHWPKLKAPTVGSAMYKSTVNAWRAKVSPLRTAAKTVFETLLDPVKWPDHRSAETYDAEVARIAPDADM